MKSHVLSVGQCGADDSRLARVLNVEANAHMDRAATVEDRIVGEVVVLSTSGAAPDSRELSEVAGALCGFSIPYRWADADESAYG